MGVVFGIKVRGLIAWFMWRGYYWSRVPGIGGKARVALDWALNALFGSDPVQLKVDYERGGRDGPIRQATAPASTHRSTRVTVR